MFSFPYLSHTYVKKVYVILIHLGTQKIWFCLVMLCSVKNINVKDYSVCTMSPFLVSHFSDKSNIVIDFK